MYSLKSFKEEKETSEGCIQQEIRHQDYLECLQEVKTSMEKQTKIAQDVNHLYTLTQNKISPSLFYNKRYLLDDGISILAYEDVSFKTCHIQKIKFWEIAKNL